MWCVFEGDEKGAIDVSRGGEGVFGGKRHYLMFLRLTVDARQPTSYQRQTSSLWKELLASSGVDMMRSAMQGWKCQWNDGASINDSTGALRINLIHIFRIDSQPKLLDRFNKLRVFKIGSAYVVTTHTRPTLESVIIPGKDHLFLLDKGDSSYGYLILRRLDDSRSFSLVCVCAEIYFRCIERLRGFESPKSLTTLNLSLLQARTIRALSNVQRYFRTEIEKTLWDGERYDYNGMGMIQIFPEKTLTLTGILPVIQALLNEKGALIPIFLTLIHPC
jgi:hypothetical protein